MKTYCSLLFLGLLGLSLGTGVVQGSETTQEGESGSAHVTYRGQHFVAETKKFKVECTLTQFDQLKWTHNGKLVMSGEGGYTTKELPGPKGYVKSCLTVENAHVYHAGEYKCTPFSPRSHTVYVLSADAAGSESIQLMYETYPVKFTCNFTDPDNVNPEGPSSEAQTSIHLDWFKDGEPITLDERIKVFQENFTLLIMKADREDVGIYKCQTKTGDDMLSKTIRLIFLEIRKMEKSQIVLEMQSISIDCPADGIPPPSITWLKDQKPVDEFSNNTRITVTQEAGRVINSSLVIITAKWEDRGNYSCVITSLMKSYEKWTFLRVKDARAALWPFIGIVAEVVILGIIIVIFEKRRAKAEFDESDTDQGNDQKKTGDRNKDRRRK